MCQRPFPGKNATYLDIKAQARNACDLFHCPSFRHWRPAATHGRLFIVQVMT